jgi:hypothetical protein
MLRSCPYKCIYERRYEYYARVAWLLCYYVIHSTFPESIQINCCTNTTKQTIRIILYSPENTYVTRWTCRNYLSWKQRVYILAQNIKYIYIRGIHIACNTFKYYYVMFGITFLQSMCYSNTARNVCMFTYTYTLTYICTYVAMYYLPHRNYGVQLSYYGMIRES